MDNPNIEARLGDILHGKNNQNYNGVKSHFIIYLGPDLNSPEQFLGAMLTSSSGFSNVGLQEDHFETHSNGHKWRIVYKASFISSDLYHKKNEWRPFTKVGQLTRKGLQFVINQIGDRTPIYFPFNK